MEESKGGHRLEELRKSYPDEPKKSELGWVENPDNSPEGLAKEFAEPPYGGAKKDDLRKYESVDPIMQFFGFDHLPFPLRDVSRPFCDLAKHIVETLPWNHERTVALRKLLESKDAAVRAAIFKPGV